MYYYLDRLYCPPCHIGEGTEGFSPQEGIQPTLFMVAPARIELAFPP